MEDLVGVRVADAAEEMRIGQRALDGVILARQCLAGLIDLHRRALLRARFGEEQRAMRELESRQDHPRGDAGLLPGRAPAQPPPTLDFGQDDPELVEESNSRTRRLPMRRMRRTV
jgi:hypothetical protein